MTFDYDHAFLNADALPRFRALDPEEAQRYGEFVRAGELSNAQYDQRFQRLAKQNNMRPPPSHGRIFSGYLVVRRVGQRDQYETWMPDHVFEELYAPA